MCALPVAIGIAIVRTRLFDIELVLSRTLTYGVLTLLVLGAYAGLLALTGMIFGNSTAGGMLAVAVVAVAAAPTQRWLRDRIERWVYGYRSEPAPRRADDVRARRCRRPTRPAPRDHRHGHGGAHGATSLGGATRHRRLPATNVVRAPLVHQGMPLGSPRRRDATRARPSRRRHAASARPRPAGRGPGPRRAAHRRPAGLPVADRRPRARRSESGCAETCTTVWARPWPRWCSS